MSPTRAEMMKEAVGWIGTPYVKGGQIKGKLGGCDCATFVYCTVKNSGFALQEMPSVPETWWVGSKEECYLRQVLRYGVLLSDGAETMTMMSKVEPGTILLSRVAKSHHYNHAAIVLAWPRVIHAVRGGVTVCNALSDPMWAYKQIAMVDLWKDK